MTGQTESAVTYLERASTLTERVGLKRRPGDEKAFADALLAQMRADGLLSVVVPPAFGGPGLNLIQTARITERIARASGSAGLTYAMHMSQALSVVRHGRGAFFEDFQRRMVRDQILIASGTSEKGPGGDIFTSIATVDLDPAGRITGAKESPNISYLDHAGAILLTANMAQPKGPDRQVLIVLEMADVQVTVPYPSGFMGMRGILNQPVALRFSAARAAVFPDLFAPIARRTMTPCIQVLWAALWSGIAWAVLDKAKRFVQNEISADAEVAALARHDLSVLINTHYAMNAMIRDVIAAYDGDTGKGGIGFGAAAQINRLKVCCSDWLGEICTGALRLIGIRGYATGGPYTLAEPLADALSAPIMVSNTRLLMNTAAIESFVDEAL
jgi:acyl-CoA dehydrogenase